MSTQQARRLEGSPLLPEGTQVPAQNLEGVMRSLDMVERALEEAMLMADAMPGPEESAIGKSGYSKQSSMHVAGHVSLVSGQPIILICCGTCTTRARRSHIFLLYPSR